MYIYIVFLHSNSKFQIYMVWYSVCFACRLCTTKQDLKHKKNNEHVPILYDFHALHLQNSFNKVLNCMKYCAANYICWLSFAAKRMYIFVFSSFPVRKLFLVISYVRHFLSSRVGLYFWTYSLTGHVSL